MFCQIAFYFEFVHNWAISSEILVRFISCMPQLENTPALANQLMNLSTEDSVKIFVPCIRQARDKMLMIKIEYHRNIILSSFSI